jgi:hypothetical protein
VSEIYRTRLVRLLGRRRLIFGFLPPSHSLTVITLIPTFRTAGPIAYHLVVVDLFELYDQRMEPRPFYLILRITQVAEFDPIEELAKILTARGCVWYAKYGRLVRITNLHESPLELVLSVRHKGRYRTASFKVDGVSLRRPSIGCYPSYYDLSRATLWFKLSRGGVVPSLDDLITKSSRRPIREAMSLSSSSHFWCVRENA